MSSIHSFYYISALWIVFFIHCKIARRLCSKVECLYSLLLADGILIMSRLYNFSVRRMAVYLFLWTLKWTDNVYIKKYLFSKQCDNFLQLHYIHSSPGGSSCANPPVVSAVYAYVGTPPAQRQLSSLVWRLGPTHFLEEVLPPSSVSTIYELGPNYVGSFQAVYMPCK